MHEDPWHQKEIVKIVINIEDLELYLDKYQRKIYTEFEITSIMKNVKL